MPVRRQNKLWRKITQDSSSRVRNLKHPAMCTASSRAPGGARWMPISLLFCHTVPPVSRQSCHRYSLYMETDTSRCGTWVYTTRTCMIDAKHFLPGCLCEPHEHSTSVHCTDTYTVLGRSLTQRVFQRGASSCAAQTTTMMMISSSHTHDERLSRWLMMFHVGVPKHEETPATVKSWHAVSHKIPRYQLGRNG